MHQKHSLNVEIVEFHKGFPDIEMMAKPLIIESSKESFELDTYSLLTYGDDGGSDNFRESLCKFVNKASEEIANGTCTPCKPDEFFSTSGNSHAMSVLTTKLLSPSKPTVVVDDPTYPFALDIFRDHHAKLVGVKQIEGQTDVAGMRKAIIEAKERGEDVAFIYVIPSFHNPTGSCMTAENRKKLVQMCQEMDVYILADDVYQLLYFGPEPSPPALATFEEGTEISKCRVLSMGSFSKICAPALRCGWIYSKNTEFLKSLTNFGELKSGGGFSAFAQRVIEGMLREQKDGTSRQMSHLKFLRNRLKSKGNTICDALDAYCKDFVSYVRPKGGYFVWLKLDKKFQDKGLDGEKVLEKCRENGVNYFSGPIFSPTKDFKDCIRFSFAMYSEEELQKGIERFSKILKKML